MNKKRIFAAAVIICFLIMIQQYQVREQKIADSPIDIETAYEMLNQDIFGNREIDWYSDMLEKEVHEYSKEVKEEFVSVEYDGNLFPSELVAMMEEELYQLEKTDGEIDDTWYDTWYEILDVFGARDFILGLDDLYQLFPELNVHRDEIETVYDAYHYIMPDIINIKGYCEEIFHFSMEPGKDNYVFLYEAGGETYRDYVVWLTEKAGDQFVTVDEFETRNYGGGEVIQYEGAYYYVFLQRNLNLYNVDGIRIYRLGDNMRAENILINYLPETYIWKNIYQNDAEFGTGVQDYIDSIKSEITSDEYLENGQEWFSTYDGDETLERVSVIDKGSGISRNYDKIDFANIAIPVLMSKGGYWNEVGKTIPCHVLINFYLCDAEKETLLELENMELDRWNATDIGIELMQMWFREINNKVLTFRIYHISDYNYILNTTLVEGNKTTLIRNDMFSPQRKIVLTEGEGFILG